MLTDENIAKINALIQDHALLSCTQLGAKYGSGKSPNSKSASIASFISVLRHFGVDIPSKHPANGNELAEFRAWKAQQQRLAAE